MRVLINGKKTPKPEWLRVKNNQSPNRAAVEDLLKNLNLNTVCSEADCPNYGVCFSRKTATFMILGKTCTRNCGFCNVSNGSPESVNPDEPANIAKAVKSLGLQYVVVTSVTRDDLPDGGAAHFSQTISEIQKATPHTLIEVLVPDFAGNIEALETVANSSPDVISHNMETVKRLYPHVRPQADYERSLDLIRQIKKANPKIKSKSGIMVGFGETADEVYMLFDDLINTDCDFFTSGQYLQPTRNHVPVVEYVEPDVFDEYGAVARGKGFKFVASAPLVRSSFNAGEALGV